MKQAFCSVCLERHSMDDMLRIASQCGYKALELIVIPGWIHANLREIEPEALLEKIKSYGMDLIALYPGGVDTSSAENIAENLAYIRHTIEVAHKLEVKKMVFTGADGHEHHERAIQAYRTLVPYLEEADVTLCLENHYNNQLEFPEDYERLFHAIESSYIGMTIDTGHYTSSQVDILALIDRFHSRVGHIHLKDHIGTQSVAIGRGETDNPAILKRLHHYEYDSHISLELEVRDYENVETYVAEAKELIDGYIASANE